MTTYRSGETFKCPHCGKEQEDNVDDYVVHGPHGRMGFPYKNECGWCDGRFSVTHNSDKTYVVQAVEQD